MLEVLLSLYFHVCVCVCVECSRMGVAFQIVPHVKTNSIHICEALLLPSLPLFPVSPHYCFTFTTKLTACILRYILILVRKTTCN